MAHAIRALVPALDDLNLRRRLAVKRYDEMLTDMNARHIARLDAEQFAAFNRVFRRHRDVLDYFGYDIVDGGAQGGGGGKSHRPSTRSGQVQE